MSKVFYLDIIELEKPTHKTPKKKKINKQFQEWRLEEASKRDNKVLIFKTRVNNFKFTVSCGSAIKENYGNSQVDIFALYAMPIKTWWIIPFESIEDNRKTITTNTHLEKYKKYINNFDLI